MRKLRIYCCKDYDEMSNKAAALVAAKIISDNCAVLGLATGSTPEGLYKRLVQWNNDGLFSFEKVQTVNLDEYCGLPADHDQSYAYFMRHNLLDHIDIKLENTHLPDGMELDPKKACEDYDKVLEEVGRQDVQLLGLGNNGHIGFNEPGDEFKPNVNHVMLTQSTIEANARFFDSIDDVPKSAYTMGFKAIMRAKQILLVVSGAGKADILEKSLFGPITPKVPASLLQLHHDVIVYADEDAMSKIKELHPEAVLSF